MGLQELLEIAGIRPEDVNEETVGFQIVSSVIVLSLNGRLDDPNPAIVNY